MRHYDCCVIGAGMVGSAASKYCSILNKNGSTLLIGPEEPHKNDYGQSEIFGAYFDEGRIVKNLYYDPIWAYLSIASVQRYHDIEEESKIKFYTENGFLTLLDEGDQNIEKISNLARGNHVDFMKLSNAEEIKIKFPYLNPLPNTVGLLELAKAGSINPRLLVKAQQVIATKLGTEILRDIVVKLNNNENGFEIHTKKNGRFSAKKVILCVGAYLFHNNLLPNYQRQIDVKCGLISTARIPVDKAVVEKLSGMPSITLTTENTYLSQPQNKSEAFYMMPPIKYPDDVWYLKLGYHSHARKGLYGNPAEITDWYRNGQHRTNIVRKKLSEIAQCFIPDLKVNFETVVSDTCAIMETPNDRPYIDEISQNLFIVTGCNGFSAKSSDEFGRIVATLAVFNFWDCPFPSTDFKCRYIESKL